MASQTPTPMILAAAFTQSQQKIPQKKGGGETGKQEGQTQLCGEGLRRLHVLLAISERLLLCGQNLSRSAHKKTALCTELRNSNGRRFHSVPTAGSTGSSGSTATSAVAVVPIPIGNWPANAHTAHMGKVPNWYFEQARMFPNCSLPRRVSMVIRFVYLYVGTFHSKR